MKVSANWVYMVLAFGVSCGIGGLLANKTASGEAPPRTGEQVTAQWNQDHPTELVQPDENLDEAAERIANERAAHAAADAEYGATWTNSGSQMTGSGSGSAIIQ